MNSPLVWIDSAVTPLKLALMTRAPFDAAHRAPALMWLIRALSLGSFATRIGMIDRFQPTPLTPVALSPIAAAEPATCVPWSVRPSTRPPIDCGRPSTAL